MARCLLFISGFNPITYWTHAYQHAAAIQIRTAWWTVTAHGTHEGHLVLYYTNNKTKEEEKSSVKEVRDWYNRTQLNNATTHLIRDSNSIVPTRKGFINAIAKASFKAITQYEVKLPHKNVIKPTSFKKAGNSEHPQWFRRIPSHMPLEPRPCDATISTTLKGTCPQRIA
jgi:hypothetical protein